jgi:hypothetical protein
MLVAMSSKSGHGRRFPLALNRASAKKNFRLFFNPEGISSTSEGLLGTSYPGFGAFGNNPEGGCINRSAPHRKRFSTITPTSHIAMILPDSRPSVSQKKSSFAMRRSCPRVLHLWCARIDQFASPLLGERHQKTSCQNDRMMRKSQRGFRLQSAQIHCAQKFPSPTQCVWQRFFAQETRFAVVQKGIKS